MGCPVEEQFSQGCHGFSPHFLALILDSVKEASDDAVFKNLWVDDSGVSDEQSQNLAYFGPECGLFVGFEKFHVVGYEIAFEEIVGDIRILNNTLKITKNVVFLFPLHAIQYFFEFHIHLAIDDPIGQHFRLEVLKAKSLLIEVEALDNLNLFIADDGFDRVVGLMVDDILDRRHAFGAEGFHEDVDGGRILHLVVLFGPF